MNVLAEPTPNHPADPPRGAPDWRALRAALLVGTGYYVGTRIGLTLTFDPFPLAVLWPPNALLLIGLLLSPVRWWWLLVLAAFPAHLLAELQHAVPLPMVLCWFVSNVGEALLGALLLRRYAGPLPALGTVRSVIAFSAAAVLAPFLSSFVDAAFVRLVGWGSAGYWSLWETRLLSNLLAMLTFVPVALTWAGTTRSQLRHASRARMREVAALLTGLLAVSIVAFDSDLASGASSLSLLYLPMPFLVWAALRFGPPLTSVSFAIVAFLVIWGARHGRGPFLQFATHDDAMPVQLFLITIAVPLLLLAAVIEERRLAERRLLASEDLFSTAFKSSPDALAISRLRDGRIIEANGRWLDLLGYKPDELALGGVAPLEAHVVKLDRAKLASNGNVSDTGDIEVQLLDRQGHPRQVLVRTQLVELQGESCAIVILRDVTEQRHAERQAHEQRQQLTHLTRVASLTEFSSTLAHELNQPLTAILSNAQAALRFLERDPPDVTEVRSILDEIAEADKRAGLLIHHLRLLMKRGEEEFVRIDLNQLVQAVLDLLHSEFVTRDVEVHASLSRDLPHVTGDKVQLQQLMLNLVSNACDAMHDGRRAGRRTLNVTTVHGIDGSVQVIVNDTGPGIAADQLDRVFEPFFTTKDSGLGLGLPISRKIARAHGGDLVAEHFDGTGASLRLVLPAAAPAAIPATVSATQRPQRAA